MKNWLKYSLINTVLGTLVGLYIWCDSSDSGKIQLIIAGIITSFVLSGFFYKRVVGKRKNMTNGDAVALGFLVGIVSHYVTLVIFGSFRIVCYWTTGGCTSSLGDPPDLFGVFLATIPASIITLIIYGWITVPAAIIGGLILKLFLTLNRKIKKEECS